MTTTIILQNVSKMLSRRGYECIDTDDMVFSNSLSSIKVFICYNSKLNIERIRSYIQILETKQIFHTIIIYDDVITSSCKKILEHMIRFTFETFHINEMLYDLTEHKFYNRHEKLSSDEIKMLKDTKYFPILLRSDPVSRYFFFQKGDVIRIFRKNGIIIYRIVK